MRRYALRLSQMTLDLLVLSTAFALAFFIRYDWHPPTDMLGRLALTSPYVVIGEYIVLVAFGVHRFSWRYFGLREATRFLFAVLTATVCLLWTRIALGELQHTYGYLRHGVIPLGIIAANAGLAFMGVTGIRVARRLVGERQESERRRRDVGVKQSLSTVLVGAGRGGLLMAKEIAARPDLGLVPVGFVDDDPDKVGTEVNGIPVLGTTDELVSLCRTHRADQVLITMASASGSTIRRISRLAEEAGVPTKTIPGLYEIADGRVNLSRIRPVAIEDLLRREPVELDLEAMVTEFRDQVVLVTGAGGSIGSELCRQVARFGPKDLLLAERCEGNLFEIHRELRERHPELTLTPLIADVSDRARMEGIFQRRRPSVVIHAAAHKHVPMMEWNPAEAVKNNVFGTRLLADLSHEYQVRSFVLISTDKAVNPSSVMGATKRMAELVVQARASDSKTRFVTVRFGNVLGSTGSVVPIFKRQIAQGGPITVTHPDMRRYFMTIPEACQLVLQASTMGEGGEIFILDMGEPVRIVDLATDLIRLSGLRAGEDIEIAFTGTREGEKLFEELSIDGEDAAKTKHPKIFIGHLASMRTETVDAHLSRLSTAVESDDPQAVIGQLAQAVAEYVPKSNPPLPAKSERPASTERGAELSPVGANLVARSAAD